MRRLAPFDLLAQNAGRAEIGLYFVVMGGGKAVRDAPERRLQAAGGEQHDGDILTGHRLLMGSGAILQRSLTSPWTPVRDQSTDRSRPNMHSFAISCRILFSASIWAKAFA
jgi:hypothetical protein